MNLKNDLKNDLKKNDFKKWFYLVIIKNGKTNKVQQ